jgi:hypothetical protein
MGRPTYAKATAGPGVVGSAKFFCGRPTYAEATAGPGKVGAAKFFYGPIAQSVEQLAFNQWVGGSNPPRLNFLPMRTLLKQRFA